MKCFECGKKIDILADTCPFCGAEQFDDKPPVDPVFRPKKVKQRKESQLIISDFDAVLLGLHKDDKEYEDYLKNCIMLGIDE